jgi:hypothetical protein
MAALSNSPRDASLQGESVDYLWRSVKCALPMAGDLVSDAFAESYLRLCARVIQVQLTASASSPAASSARRRWTMGALRHVSDAG